MRNFDLGQINTDKKIVLHYSLLCLIIAHFFVSLYLWTHTVRKSQIVSKNSIFQNLNFCAKNKWIYCEYDKLISIRIWIFTPKNGQNSTLFSIIVDSGLT